MKICSQCKESKILVEFRSIPSRKSVRANCKSCEAKYAKKWQKNSAWLKHYRTTEKYKTIQKNYQSDSLKAKEYKPM